MPSKSWRNLYTLTPLIAAARALSSLAMPLPALPPSTFRLCSLIPPPLTFPRPSLSLARPPSSALPLSQTLHPRSLRRCSFPLPCTL
ncbi:hypothetical protein AHAS_Ahas14G0024700 [Arachis hypogaea]